MHKRHTYKLYCALYTMHSAQGIYVKKGSNIFERFLKIYHAHNNFT